ncbi:LCP family protein [Virgisporangium aurantiacum]|uniref:LytTR family transcriptional regulator n=1 Tax=Virgisporangium aurantiacum TaxID=175570 RepID=A0A8J4E396_9ACTN|nr:LCP family protein [Virgisporangium aurantiacum]GIJ59743.1 LytTR family transcriptional regulator [Virgisporangium aurantiacum]
MIEELMRETFARHEDLAPAPEPVRRRIDTVATKRRRLRRGAVGCTVVAVIALVAATFMRVDAVRTAPQLGASAVSTFAGKPMTILLVGTDRRPWDTNRSELLRSDSIMLAHLPADRSAPYVISLARDHFVPFQGRTDKLNGVFAIGGAAALRDAVQALTGVTVDGVVEVDFAGLIAVTDAVGGVDLCVEKRVVSRHTQRIFDPGCRRFSGDEAMDYLRQGHTTDSVRQQHGRAYVKALLARLTGADLSRFVRVLDAARQAIRVDLGPAGLAGVFAVVKDVKPDTLAGIAPPATPDGQLLPAAAELWTAVRDGTLPAWVAANPDRVDQR